MAIISSGEAQRALGVRRRRLGGLGLGALMPGSARCRQRPRGSVSISSMTKTKCSKDMSIAGLFGSSVTHLRLPSSVMLRLRAHLRQREVDRVAVEVHAERAHEFGLARARRAVQQQVDLAPHARKRVVARRVAELVHQRVWRPDERLLLRVEERLVVGALHRTSAAHRLLLEDGHRHAVRPFALRPACEGKSEALLRLPARRGPSQALARHSELARAGRLVLHGEVVAVRLEHHGLRPGLATVELRLHMVAYREALRRLAACLAAAAAAARRRPSRAPWWRWR